jgi:RNA polymerase sigma factor (sigma-70 family)
MNAEQFGEQFGERGDRLWAAILRLPKYERLVLALVYFEDLSEAEAGKILELDLATVQLLRERAIRRLRESLK